MYFPTTSKLLINNLPVNANISTQDLVDIFSLYGRVVSVIFIDSNSAVVEYEYPEDAKYALEDEHIIAGRKVSLEKYYHTPVELNVQDRFRGNFYLWKDMLKKIFPHVKASEVILSDVFPKEMVENGTRIFINVTLEYENMLADNLIKLVYDPTDYGKKMKTMLNQHNDFAYYNVNISYIDKESIEINPYSKNVRVGVIIAGELIQSEDYYGTIGAYRITWENICEKEKFSKKELIKLAEDLKINYSQGDDLCHIIGQRVNNLMWDDFIED